MLSCILLGTFDSFATSGHVNELSGSLVQMRMGARQELQTHLTAFRLVEVYKWLKLSTDWAVMGLLYFGSSGEVTFPNVDLCRNPGHCPERQRYSAL